MRKIEPEYENFIDDKLIDFADTIDPYFYKLNFSPNDITTLSLISGLLCISLFMQEYYIGSAICYFISYFFDCMDGNFARKYNMVTYIGDLYDHIKDYSIIIILSYLLIGKFKNHPNRYIYLIIMIIIGLLACVHFGCQEIYYDNPTITIKWCQSLCPADKKNVANALKYTRYCGLGTFTLSFCLFIALTPYLSQKN